MCIIPLLVLWGSSTDTTVQVIQHWFWGSWSKGMLDCCWIKVADQGGFTTINICCLLKLCPHFLVSLCWIIEASLFWWAMLLHGLVVWCGLEPRDENIMLLNIVDGSSLMSMELSFDSIRHFMCLDTRQRYFVTTYLCFHMFPGQILWIVKVDWTLVALLAGWGSCHRVTGIHAVVYQHIVVSLQLSDPKRGEHTLN